MKTSSTSTHTHTRNACMVPCSCSAIVHEAWQIVAMASSGSHRSLSHPVHFLSTRRESQWPNRALSHFINHLSKLSWHPWDREGGRRLVETSPRLPTRQDLSGLLKAVVKNQSWSVLRSKLLSFPSLLRWPPCCCFNIVHLIICLMNSRLMDMGPCPRQGFDPRIATPVKPVPRPNMGKAPGLAKKPENHHLTSNFAVHAICMWQCKPLRKFIKHD